MHIVTDSGTDLRLPPEQMAELEVHTIPLVVTLDGKSYREAVDIQTEEFYKLLDATDSLPVTSQPSAGDFAETYRRLAATDPDILSIHITSGLSGTVNSAQVGASQVPEANVTVVDTKTLSAAAGWQVEAALRGVKAGWSKEQILALMARIGDASDSLYTLNELKYLIHGGRISHMKGLIASLLDLKPMIGVEKVGGTYAQRGQTRSFKGAVKGLADLIQKQHAPGSALEGAGTAFVQPGRRRAAAPGSGQPLQLHLAAGRTHVAGAGCAHRAFHGRCGVCSAGGFQRYAIGVTNLIYL
jgi:DegV family protein with EDD domain